MNKFLSKALAGVNALIAVLITFVGGSAGAAAWGSLGEPAILGFIIGLFLGLILAVLICGTLALLINIRDEIVLANNSLNDLKKEQT